MAAQPSFQEACPVREVLIVRNYIAATEKNINHMQRTARMTQVSFPLCHVGIEIPFKRHVLGCKRKPAKRRLVRKQYEDSLLFQLANVALERHKSVPLKFRHHDVSTHHYYRERPCIFLFQACTAETPRLHLFCRSLPKDHSGRFRAGLQ